MYFVFSATEIPVYIVLSSVCIPQPLTLVDKYILNACGNKYWGDVKRFKGFCFILLTPGKVMVI